MNEQLVGRPQLTGAIATRAAAVAPATVNDAQRTFEVVWTTGAMVRRYSWMRDEEYDEELVVDDKALRLEALNSGAPFLETHRAHDLGAVLGVVVEGSVRIESGKGYATIRLSDRDEVESLWRDIKAGIIRRVSVGYRVHKFERVAKADRNDGGERALYRAVDWEPLEISAVAIGADPAAGIRGDHAGEAPEILEQGKKPMKHATTTPDAGANTVPSAASTIRALVAHHNFGDDLAEDLIGRGLSESEARHEILDKLADRDPMQGRSHEPSITGNNRDGLLARAMSGAMLHRLDPARHECSQDARDFAGMTVPEMAAEFCRIHDIRVQGGPAKALQIALQMRSGVGYHSTSDFPAILANVANLRVLDHYEAAASGFKRVSRERTFDDFREVTSARLQGSMTFEKTLESGEFKYGTLEDSGEKTRLATYGRIFALTRQALVNDAEGAFDKITSILGTGAAETEAGLLVGLFEDNAGTGPTLSDTLPVFHEDRVNIGQASVIDIDALSEAMVILRRQRGMGGEVIAVVPRYIIVSPEKETEALQATSQLYAAEVQNVNPFARRLEVIVEPRLASETRWYLAAEPGRPEALIHGYLRGQRGPQIETRMGFEVDGMEVKGRIDFAAGFVDWRGWVMNPGA
ncbi:prohead protease/major capsid protein fusion protein [Alkalilacustris brevis]|uniref:prohead protease/major capsid protein fusion protein n=1 Tax=Alkalilacustris brevis TaxID=2026338 RepID=UPI0013903EA6|nr:prohead protease/major capsid protein fusion protein [Alkalilacustris brevis]